MVMGALGADECFRRGAVGAPEGGCRAPGALRRCRPGFGPPTGGGQVTRNDWLGSGLVSPFFYTLIFDGFQRRTHRVRPCPFPRALATLPLEGLPPVVCGQGWWCGSPDNPNSHGADPGSRNPNPPILTFPTSSIPTSLATAWVAQGATAAPVPSWAPASSSDSPPWGTWMGIQ